jgi:hypothetical protein
VEGAWHLVYKQRGLDDWVSQKIHLCYTANMPRASTRIPTRRSSSYSPVQENNFNIDRFSHARWDPSRLYPTLGAVMDRTATADPKEGFSDLGGGSGCAFRFRKAN